MYEHDTMEPLVPGLTHPAPCSHQQVTTTVASATAGAWVHIQQVLILSSLLRTYFQSCKAIVCGALPILTFNILIRVVVAPAENGHPCCSVVVLGGGSGWLGTATSAVTRQLLLSSEAVLGGATSPPAGITLESRAQYRAH